MKREARLQNAPRWLSTYPGANLLRGYERAFGVDLECAAVELGLLGIEVDPQQVAAITASRAVSRILRQPTPPGTDAIPPGYGEEWDDTFAYIAGFTSGGAPFGVTWEEEEAMAADGPNEGCDPEPVEVLLRPFARH